MKTVCNDCGSHWDADFPHLHGEPVHVDACTDCDGLGRYTGWPHTTCPTCEGAGVVALEDKRP